MSAIASRVSGGLGGGRARIRALYRTHSPTLMLGSLLAVFALVAVWQWITVVVPAGHVGVQWYRFAGGTDTQTVYGEGNRFIWPWDKMAVYDARLQQFSRDFDVLTRDGLTMTVNIAARFRLNVPTVALLHKHVGPDYVDTLLVPTVGSFARIIFSQNSTDGVYTDRRVAVQTEIKQAVAVELDRFVAQQGQGATSWVQLDDLLIRSMRFPAEIQDAVNRKMAQHEVRQEYDYRLEREELESRRKEVEAQGIARFQSIVGAGISDTYLRWKGIDATLALAQSPNAKVVVIGTGKDGMPLILGGLDQSAPARPVAEAPAAVPAAPEAKGAKGPEGATSGTGLERRSRRDGEDDGDSLQRRAETSRRDAVEAAHLPVPLGEAPAGPQK